MSKKDKNKKDPQIKERKTFTAKFTKYELLHLRDLMSILLPPNGAQTLSAALASVEGRAHVEVIMWKRVAELCLEAGLPMGDSAPDFIIAATAMPTLGVCRLAEDPNSEDEEEDRPLFKQHVPGDEDE